MLSDSQFGAADSTAAAAIDRSNRLAELRTGGRYEELAQALEADLGRYGGDAYVAARLRNELAELYSYQLLDIERAIRLDEALASAEVPDADPKQLLVPRVDVANQRILADRRYLNDYLRVSSATIREKQQRRLATNRALLAGETPKPARSYDAAFLRQHLATVTADLPSTHAGTPERRTVQSRRLRAELELLRLDGRQPLEGHEVFLRGELTAANVDLAEIDYLGLAQYLMAAARQSGRIELAEMALEVVYRPYSRIAESSARWRYNRIINDTIAALVEASFQADRHEDMLYYVSLNKSRLLLEERLALSAKGRQTQSLSAAAALDGIPRTAAGLPDKSWFQQGLRATDSFLDFYLVTQPQPPGAARPAAAGQVRRSASTGPLLTRDFGLEDASTVPDAGLDTALYMTRIAAGRVVLARRAGGAELERFRAQSEALYDAVSSQQRKAAVEPPALLAPLRADLRTAGSVVVSPDKWLSKQPFDALLDVPTTRAVNLFTAAKPSALGGLDVAGYFNPTLDLPGAEREADAIRRVLPTARVLKREAATLQTLAAAQGANIIHLSMHGSFNASDPRNSKLYFAGARSDRGRTSSATDDPAALYARDMAAHPALQRKDLVFAAACQTGLSGAEGANDAELLGILRPLTAAGNRNVILSLWNVDDTATQVFVGAFYEHLARDRDVTRAFHAAQREVRRQYPQPYYWAAFYLAQSS